MNTVPATKPEYRALTLYDHLPEGCIAQLVTDNFSVPHIRAGEFVVVDTNDREVRHLEIYVIEWNNGTRNVCEAVSKEFNFTDKTIPRQGWAVRSISGLRGKAALDVIDNIRKNGNGGIAFAPPFAWSEGPFRSDDGYLESKLVGCVIGIYQPTAVGPKLIAGGSK